MATNKRTEPLPLLIVSGYITYSVLYVLCRKGTQVNLFELHIMTNRKAISLQHNTLNSYYYVMEWGFVCCIELQEKYGGALVNSAKKNSWKANRPKQAFVLYEISVREVTFITHTTNTPNNIKITIKTRVMRMTLCE
uniref:Uncharacterized protein n=2 Tax=Cacopsylla melanoneura TaxID=428564 RepID=A0A8D9FFQ7_9HEMI